MTRSRSTMGGRFAAPALVASTLSLLACQPAHAQFNVTYTTADPPLSDQGYGDYYGYLSAAYGISNSGTYVGAYTDATGSDPGYINPNGTPSTLNYVNPVTGAPAEVGSETELDKINDSGAILGSYYTFDPNTGNLTSTTPFIYNYNSDGKFDNTPTIASATAASFTGINNNGLVSVNYQTASSYSFSDGSTGYASGIYNLAANSFTALPGYDNSSSNGSGVNTVESTTINGLAPNAVLNSNGTITGSFVGACKTPDLVTQGLVYQNGSYSVLDAYIEPDGTLAPQGALTPGAAAAPVTILDQINAEGLITGSFYTDTARTAEDFFVYNPSSSTYTEINDPDGTNTFLNDISGTDANGTTTVVGSYVSSTDGDIHSFTAQLSSSSASAPEPTALALLAPGALSGMVMLVRRRRPCVAIAAV